MESQSMNRGTFQLAGLRHSEYFPGWEGKAGWLGQLFDDLDKRIAGLPGLRSTPKYFIYHFVPWEGFIVAVEIEDGVPLPPGFFHIEVPDRRYDIYPHTGPMAHQPQTFERICAAEGWEPDEEIVHFELYDGNFHFARDTGHFEICIPVRPIRTESYGSNKIRQSKRG